VWFEQRCTRVSRPDAFGDFPNFKFPNFKCWDFETLLVGLMKRVSEIYFWYPFYLCQVYKATSIVRFSPLDLWTMTLSSLSSWADYFSSNKQLESLNHHLVQIRNTVSRSTPFMTSFGTISKNQGISLLSFEPSESKLQLFHHCSTFGGSIRIRKGTEFCHGR